MMMQPQQHYYGLSPAAGCNSTLRFPYPFDRPLQSLPDPPPGREHLLLEEELAAAEGTSSSDEFQPPAWLGDVKRNLRRQRAAGSTREKEIEAATSATKCHTTTHTADGFAGARLPAPSATFFIPPRRKRLPPRFRIAAGKAGVPPYPLSPKGRQLPAGAITASTRQTVNFKEKAPAYEAAKTNEHTQAPAADGHGRRQNHSQAEEAPADMTAERPSLLMHAGRKKTCGSRDEAASRLQKSGACLLQLQQSESNIQHQQASQRGERQTELHIRQAHVKRLQQPSEQRHQQERVAEEQTELAKEEHQRGQYHVCDRSVHQQAAQQHGTEQQHAQQQQHCQEGGGYHGHQSLGAFLQQHAEILMKARVTLSPAPVEKKQQSADVNEEDQPQLCSKVRRRRSSRIEFQSNSTTPNVGSSNPERSSYSLSINESTSRERSACLHSSMNNRSSAGRKQTSGSTGSCSTTSGCWRTAESSSSDGKREVLLSTAGHEIVSPRSGGSRADSATQKAEPFLSGSRASSTVKAAGISLVHGKENGIHPFAAEATGLHECSAFQADEDGVCVFVRSCGVRGVATVEAGASPREPVQHLHTGSALGVTSPRGEVAAGEKKSPPRNHNHPQATAAADGCDDSQGKLSATAALQPDAWRSWVVRFNTEGDNVPAGPPRFYRVFSSTGAARAHRAVLSRAAATAALLHNHVSLCPPSRTVYARAVAPAIISTAFADGVHNFGVAAPRSGSSFPPIPLSAAASLPSVDLTAAAPSSSRAAPEVVVSFPAAAFSSPVFCTPSGFPIACRRIPSSGLADAYTTASSAASPAVYSAAITQNYGSTQQAAPPMCVPACTPGQRIAVPTAASSPLTSFCMQQGLSIQDAFVVRTEVRAQPAELPFVPAHIDSQDTDGRRKAGAGVRNMAESAGSLHFEGRASNVYERCRGYATAENPQDRRSTATTETVAETGTAEAANAQSANSRAGDPPRVAGDSNFSGSLPVTGAPSALDHCGSNSMIAAGTAPVIGGTKTRATGTLQPRDRQQQWVQHQQCQQQQIEQQHQQHLSASSKQDDDSISDPRPFWDCPRVAFDFITPCPDGRAFGGGAVVRSSANASSPCAAADTRREEGESQETGGPYPMSTSNRPGHLQQHSPYVPLSPHLHSVSLPAFSRLPEHPAAAMLLSPRTAAAATGKILPYALQDLPASPGPQQRLYRPATSQLRRVTRSGNGSSGEKQRQQKRDKRTCTHRREQQRPIQQQ